MVARRGRSLPHRYLTTGARRCYRGRMAFADGELNDIRAATFRDHLRTCTVCADALHEIMLLQARLSTLPQR